ncbi:MAG: hypothetical protein WC505_07060 [Patescibacteria group bacterium]
MKIRTGFVSNSSSSSFLIWGITVDTSEFQKEIPVRDEDGEDCEEESPYDVAERLESEYGDIVRFAYENDILYLGRCPSTCGLDETMRKFQQRVETEVKAMAEKEGVALGDVEFGWLEEAWHD